MTVSLEFATLESKTLEVADGEKCRNREQRKRYEECGCLGAFAVQNLGQGKHDKGEQAKYGFLAGLGKEGERKGQQSPVFNGIAVVSPLENQQRKGRKENVERFHRHGAELEKYRGLQCRKQGGKEGEERHSGPSDNRKEQEQHRQREHQEFHVENPVQVVAQERHAQQVKEGEPLGLEAIGLADAIQFAVLEVPLVASARFLVVIHVLGNRHEHAFVALHAVAGFNLGAGKNRNRRGKGKHQNGNLLFGQNSLDPFPEIFMQECENDNGCNQLNNK